MQDGFMLCKWETGVNVSDELTATYVSCSNHNSTALHAASTTSVDSYTHDVLFTSQCRLDCDDVISGFGPFPLLLPPATNIGVYAMSGLFPSGLPVDCYNSCQLSFALYAWRLLLARTALDLRVATDFERSLPNHDVTTATLSTANTTARLEIVDRFLRRFRPY